MNTNRQAKRVTIQFTPEQETALRELRESIDRDEKDEIIAMGREILRKKRSAEEELRRAAKLLQTETPSQDGPSTVNEHSTPGKAAYCRLETLVAANPTIESLSQIAESLGKQLIIGLRDKVSA